MVYENEIEVTTNSYVEIGGLIHKWNGMQENRPGEKEGEGREKEGRVEERRADL